MGTPATVSDQYQYIKLPDGSYGKFSASAGDDVIRGAIQKDFPNAFAPKAPAGLPAGQTLPGLPAHAPITMPTPAGASVVGPALTAGEVLKGAAKGALHTVSGTDNFARQHLPAVLTNSNFGFGAPADEQHVQDMATPSNTAQKVGFGGEQIGEFFAPTGLEEAGGKLLGTALGKGGAVAGKLLGAGVHSGAVNTAQGGNFGTGAVGGVLGSGIGQGVQSVAPTLAEAALGVMGKDRMYGRTVGDAILRDTTGVTPGAVANSAQQKVGELLPQLEQTAADAGANGARGSLLPARAVVANKAAKLTGQRAVQSAGELQPLQDFLTKDQVTGLPLSSSQTPTGLLNLKRGLDADHISNWNPTRNSQNVLDTARQGYGALADQFHASAPGTGELDQRVSSLIPVMNRAGAADLNANVGQRVIGRLARPTGALIGAGLGATEGYREGGPAKALEYGLGGLLLPEMLANPTALMTGARLADGVAPAAAQAVNAGGQQFFRSSKDQKKP